MNKLRRNIIGAISGGSLLGGFSSHADKPILIRKPTAKNIINIFIKGGLSHVDSFDPKEQVGKQSKIINTNVDGIHLAHHFPMLAKQMDKIAIIRSMKSSQGAHEPADYYLHCSYLKQGTITHPCLGSFISYLAGKQNPSLPANVRIGGGSNGHGSGYLSSKVQPLEIIDPVKGLKYSRAMKGLSKASFNQIRGASSFIDQSFGYDNKAVKAYLEMEAEAVALMGERTQRVFDLNNEPDKIRTQYGKSTFAQGCLLARRLMENGVRFTEVVSSGWDDHNDLYGKFPARAKAVDRAIAVLIQDLEVRGLLDETLIVVSSEFGRSPTINQNGGRDHWPRAFSCLMAGGGIQGGITYGKTDAQGHSVIENEVGVEDFNATISYALGIDTNKVTMSPTLRPFKIANKGRPVFGLFKRS